MLVFKHNLSYAVRDMPNSFIEVIGLWPSLRAFSEEPEVDANLMAVRKWQQRDSIPSEEWMGIAKAAQRQGFNEVTVELFAQIKAANAIGGPRAEREVA